MGDKEIALLSRLTVNHLFLAQFEPFRAAVLTLHRRDPSLALSILHSVIVHAAGDLAPSIVWSPSCSSPAFLSWLSSLLLLRFSDPSQNPDVTDVRSPVISCADPESLRLRAEFLLYIHLIKSKISKSVDTDVGVESVWIREPDLGFEGFGVLDRIEDIGFERLRDAVGATYVVEGEEKGSGEGLNATQFEEKELAWLREAVLERGVADVFDALCLNIQTQAKWCGSCDSGLAITVRSNENQKWADEFKALELIVRNAQTAHLDAMRKSMLVGDVEGVIGHIRFLHLDYGLPEAEYRVILKDLLKGVLLGREMYGDAWLAMEGKLLSIYGEALSSNCMLLVQTIQ